jgi:uncharacterized protein GlcG (DUF336 family)
MCIAVVDSGANLKAFLRMDDAWVGSIDIAIKKAKTACFFDMAFDLPAADQKEPYERVPRADDFPCVPTAFWGGPTSAQAGV